MVLKPYFYACVLVVLAGIATAEPVFSIRNLHFKSQAVDKSYGV